MASLLSGISAGFVVVTTMQPIWLVKTRMQLQSRTHELVQINYFLTFIITKIYLTHSFLFLILEI